MDEYDDITTAAEQSNPTNRLEKEVETLVFQKRKLLSQVDQLNGRLVAVLKESKFLTELPVKLTRLSIKEWPLLNALTKFAQTKNWSQPSPASVERDSLRKELIALKIRNRVLEVERQKILHTQQVERQQFIKDMTALKKELVTTRSSREVGKRRCVTKVTNIRDERNCRRAAALANNEFLSVLQLETERELRKLRCKHRAAETKNMELGTKLEAAEARGRKLKAALEKSHMEKESLIQLVGNLKTENIHPRKLWDNAKREETFSSVGEIASKFDEHCFF